MGQTKLFMLDGKCSFVIVKFITLVVQCLQYYSKWFFVVMIVLFFDAKIFCLVCP